MTELENIVGDVARGCGALVMECADVGGHVAAVSQRMDDRVAQLGRLDTVAGALAASQHSVVDAIDQARRHSGEIKSQLLHSRGSINDSVAGFTDVIDLVIQLGNRVDRVIAALHHVEEVSHVIGDIAQQTNMLALNAAIEAARAGEAGKAFGVVAAEVKSLARDTHHATLRINGTIAALAEEADLFGREIAVGMQKGREAAAKVAGIEASVADIGSIVDLIDEQTDGIAQSAMQMHASIGAVQGEMALAADSVRDNGRALRNARQRLESLEAAGNVMLAKLASSGIRIDDTRNIEIAQDVAHEITSVVESAIRGGTFAAADVFDFEYQPVARTDPPQFTTRFNTFADRYIRPILDRVKRDVPLSIGSVISDTQGYLPTHLSLRSQPQGDDPDWNNTWSRNRRILMDDCTRRAIANQAPTMLNCYRMTLGKGEFLPLKSVFVPLRFAGRRWGNYEFAYVDEYSAAAESITPEALAASVAKAFGPAEKAAA